jgi:hypothetical protein
LFITKIIEAVAKGLKESNYKATKLELNFILDGSNDNPSGVRIVIPLKSGEK